MSDLLTVFLLSSLIVYYGGVTVALLLYAVIFPLVNKFSNKNLPQFSIIALYESDFFVGAEDEVVIKKSVSKPEKKAKLSATVVDDNKKQRFVDVHKDVPTVRLPKTKPDQKTKNLTASQIDAAAKASRLDKIGVEAEEESGDTVELPVFKVEPTVPAPKKSKSKTGVKKAANEKQI